MKYSLSIGQPIRALEMMQTPDAIHSTLLYIQLSRTHFALKLRFFQLIDWSTNQIALKQSTNMKVVILNNCKY
jgi:hypothetical protein